MKIYSINKKYGRITYYHIGNEKEVVDILQSHLTKKNIESIVRLNLKESVLISSLFIKPIYRNRGFGSSLLNKVTNKSKTILIADKRGNKTVLKFYKKAGFKKLFSTKIGPFMIRE